MKTEQEKLALARKAVFHVLDAIQYDPRKFWLMGDGTGSFDALTAAAAAFWNKDQEEVKKQFRPDVDKYERYVKELRDQEKILEGKTEEIAAASIVDEAPASLRCPACGGDVEPPDSPVWQTSNAVCKECFSRLKLVEA